LRGRIRFIEFRVLMYTQLAVITANVSVILIWLLYKMVHTFANVDQPNAWLVYWRQNSFASREIQGSEVVSPCKNPVFITWLHLSMLIDIHTSLIIPNRVTVDASYGETINLDLLPIRRPNNCDLQAVCGALEQKVLPQNHPAYENEHAKYCYSKSIGGYMKEPMLYLRRITPLAY
jgi:hypothetical protein